MNQKTWTPDRVAALTAMLADKRTFSEIALRFGLNRDCVAGKVFRLRKGGPANLLRASIHELAIGESHFYPLTPSQRHSWQTLAQYHGMHITTRKAFQDGQHGFVVRRNR